MQIDWELEEGMLTKAQHSWGNRREMGGGTEDEGMEEWGVED